MDAPAGAAGAAPGQAGQVIVALFRQVVGISGQVVSATSCVPSQKKLQVPLSPSAASFLPTYGPVGPSDDPLNVPSALRHMPVVIRLFRAAEQVMPIPPQKVMHACAQELSMAADAVRIAFLRSSPLDVMVDAAGIWQDPCCLLQA